MTSLALAQTRPADMPATYDAAKVALATCERIDECQEMANKALALAVYARQSKDDSLIIMAQKIQARAIRRCGELLKEVPSLKGQRGDLRPVDGRTKAARAAGLSAHQQAIAMRIVAIPAKEFERRVETEAPSISSLAATMRKEKPAVICCPTCGRAY